MSRLYIQLLGTPHVEYENKPVRFNGRKPLALLAYLAVTDGIHKRDSLATLFWPESDQSAARHSLREALRNINKICAGTLISPDRETVVIERMPHTWVDVRQFREQIGICMTHGHEPDKICGECIGPLIQALSFYRGRFMDGFTLDDAVEFDNWQQSQTESFRFDMSSAFERLILYFREAGELHSAILYSLRWQELERYAEESYRFLMESYARTGRREVALQQYETCAHVLNEELGVSPAETTTMLFREIQKGQGFSAIVPDDRVIISRHNLPQQLTTFVGRKEQIEEVKGLLTSSRLLTLTGAGGCGKTRLAIEAANELLDTFPDGVCFVELATLSGPDHIPQAVASALNLRTYSNLPAIETLSNFLYSKHKLIVLDNCEHLIPDCDSVVRTLLESCPQLKILATSREPLHIAGENELPISPLDIPPREMLPGTYPAGSPRAHPVDFIQRFDAILLYVERASSVLPGFCITDENATAVAEICIRLDGLPLAIELAARRVKTLPPEAILKHMSKRLDLANGGARNVPTRQRTLRDAIAWSFDLLQEPEKRLFARLAVFVGGCGYEAAIEVCEDDTSEATVLDGLASLVDKSLMQCRHIEGEPRFYMLQIIREFALEQFLMSDEAVEIKTRHASLYLRFVKEVEDGLHGAVQKKCLAIIEEEIGNVRAALTFYEFTQQQDAGLQMAAALGFFWLRRGYYTEGKRWIEAFLPESAEHTEAGAMALFWLSWIYFYLGKRQRSLDIGRRCYEISRALDFNDGMALSLSFCGYLERYRGQLEIGWSHCQQAVDIAIKNQNPWTTIQSLYFAYTRPLPDRRLGIDPELARSRFAHAISDLNDAEDIWGKAIGRHALGDMLALHIGLVEEAGRNYRESLSLFRDLDDKWMIANTLLCLGISEFKGRNIKEAENYFLEGIALFYEIGSYVFIPAALDLLARIASFKKNFTRAACLFASAVAIRKSISAEDDEFEPKRFRRIDRDDEEIVAHWSKGQKMSIRQAVDYALDRS